MVDVRQGARCMGSIDLNGGMLRAVRIALCIVATGAMAGCASVEIPASQRPLSSETMMQLGRKGMRSDEPIFVRIFKEESELEVWKQREDGRFYPFKTYPICNWSGELGPKIRQGDRQAPEGFYRITRQQMNPNSQYHLAFNLGFPNTYDQTQGRTGEFLMVHGQCKSAGCYAMTDALMEEIYALSREALAGGQDSFEVHAFPFRMTAENMARYKNSENSKFWQTLKEGYDYFELTRKTPTIGVCERRYVINPVWRDSRISQVDPQGACPAYDKVKPDPFVPGKNDQVTEERLTVSGPKLRAVASAGDGGSVSGLTNDNLSLRGILGGSARPASALTFTPRN